MILENNFMIEPRCINKALEMLGKEQQEMKLSLDNICLIHDKMVELYGGDYGIRDNALLQSVCVGPYQSVFGVDMCPTIFDKAAKYMVDFARYQIFADGNKRTGLAVAATLLNLNGYKLDMTAEQMYGLVMDIANNRITEENVKQLVKEKAVFLTKEADKESVDCDR